jgi:hypothetical protein
MPHRLALLVGATMAVFFGCPGCNQDSDHAAALLYVSVYAGDPTVLQAMEAELRANQIDNMVAKFAPTADRKIGLSASSSINAGLNFEGTYTRSQSGVTADLHGKDYGDSTTRTMTLDLASPDTDGKLSGTMTYTWGEATYTGPLTLTPVAAD